MPLLIDGELIPDNLVHEEEQRLEKLPAAQGGADEAQRKTRLRQAAEGLVIDRILVRQEAEKDPRPIDPDIVNREVEKLKAQNGCRAGFDDGPLRGQIEGQMRLQRTVRELMGPVAKPTADDVERFCAANSQNARKPERVHAAHIVRHVDELHTEVEACAGIQAALAALESGEPFAAVADRYSDCKGNGGDLGSFARGVMVEEFDNIVFAMQPVERSPIFRTPFGFHIAVVLSRTPGGIAELREAKDTIRRFLVATREQDAARRVTERLRAQAQIRRISTRAAQAPRVEREPG